MQQLEERLQVSLRDSNPEFGSPDCKPGERIVPLRLREHTFHCRHVNDRGQPGTIARLLLLFTGFCSGQLDGCVCRQLAGSCQRDLSLLQSGVDVVHRLIETRVLRLHCGLLYATLIAKVEVIESRERDLCASSPVEGVRNEASGSARKTAIGVSAGSTSEDDSGSAEDRCIASVEESLLSFLLQCESVLLQNERVVRRFCCGQVRWRQRGEQESGIDLYVLGLCLQKFGKRSPLHFHLSFDLNELIVSKRQLSVCLGGVSAWAQGVVDQDMHRFVKGFVSLDVGLGDGDQLFRSGKVKERATCIGSDLQLCEDSRLL